MGTVFTKKTNTIPNTVSIVPRQNVAPMPNTRSPPMPNTRTTSPVSTTPPTSRFDPQTGKTTGGSRNKKIKFKRMKNKTNKKQKKSPKYLNIQNNQ